MLIPVAVGAVLVQIPVALALRELWGLEGLALAMGVTTLGVLAVLLLALSPRALGEAASSLLRVSVWVWGLAALSFGVFAIISSDTLAALGGLLVYSVLLTLLRPRGLREAWGYVRELS